MTGSLTYAMEMGEQREDLMEEFDVIDPEFMKFELIQLNSLIKGIHSSSRPGGIHPSSRPLFAVTQQLTFGL